MNKSEQLRQAFENIVNEMKTCGAWDVPAPAPEAYENLGAFGMKTMALEQWLKYVFVPAVQECVDGKRPWPPTSSVGAHAIREFDGANDRAELVSRLCEFDHLFRG